MDLNKLNSKWDNILSGDDVQGYKVLRIDANCNPEVFIGISQTGSRCLVLFLPKSISINVKGTDKENLKLEYLPDKKIIYIELADNDYADLFNELVLSIYRKIWDQNEIDKYSRAFISVFYKWVEFFEDMQTTRMSDNQIMGLFGELVVLHKYIADADTFTINYILDSWRGLYDEVNDFKFDKRNIEVKTKENNKSEIHISSEFQLEKEKGKELDLVVVSVELDILNGKSLYEILFEIRNIVRAKLGDLSILLKALSQKMLDFENVKLYNNKRFTWIKQSTYSCESIDFPKLIKSELPNQIKHVKYSISTSDLNEFLKSERVYKNDH